MEVSRREFVKSGLILASGLFASGLEGDTYGLNAVRIRRDVGDLPLDDPILQTYSRAVSILQTLPSTDFRNWTNIAKIHEQFCPHGNWFFLPWHRAYLHMLENIVREVTNSPDFSLPYWDWTKDTQIPSSFWNGVLKDSTRFVTPNTTLSSESIGQKVINDILVETRFELFGSTKPLNQVSLDLKFQRSRGSASLLERTPHNDVHNWVNGNMASLLSPLDPIFWLHHCNVDRIWAQWNSNGNTNSSDGLWQDFVFKQNFALNKTQRYDVVVKDLQDTIALGYRYPGVTPILEDPIAFGSGRLFEASITEKFSQTRNSSSKLGQESVFPVKVSEKVIQQAKEIRRDLVIKGEQPRIMVAVKNVSSTTTTNVRVRVFFDCDYVSAGLTIDDPRYVGSFSFFGLGHSDHGGGGHGMELARSNYIFDLTGVLDHLNRLNKPINPEFNVQLLPVSFDGRNLDNVVVTFEDVDILLV